MMDSPATPATRRLLSIALWLLCIAAWAGTDGAADRAMEPVPPADLARAEPATRFTLEQASAELDQRLADPGLDARARANAYGKAGMLYQAHLVFGPAATCYHNAAQLAPGDARWQYYLGYLHQENGRLAQAARAYEQTLQLQPGLVTAGLRLGLVYLELGKLDEAEPLLEASAAAPGLRGAALFGLGRLAFARQHYRQAAEWLQQALAASPSATAIQYTLGLAYRALGDLERAHRYLARPGDRKPGFPDPLIDELTTLSTGQRTLFHYAMSAVYRDQYDAAVKGFQEGLKQDPDNLDARVSLARALYLNGEPVQAAVQLDEVLRRAPGHALASFLRALLFAEQGQRQRAMDAFDRSLQTDPGHPGVHFYLADELMREGDYAKAARHYAASLQREPDNDYARLREILALIQAGAPQPVLRDRLELAVDKQPGDPTLRYFLAALLAASQDQTLRDGLRALDLATSLYEQQPSAEYSELMAMACAEIGDFSKAVKLQTEALAMATGQRRLDLLPGIMANLVRFQAQEPCREPWPKEGLLIGLPALDARPVFRDYPADSPY